MYYNITGITARLDSGQGRHPRLERRGQPSPHHPFTPVALTEARGSNASRSVHQPAHRRSSGPPVIPPAADNHNSQTRLRRSDESESITATTASGTLAVGWPATASGHSPAGHWQDGSACHQSRSAYLTTLPRVTGALAHPPFSSVTSAPQRQARLS